MLDRSELESRLSYRGGRRQEERMQGGKLRALRRSLIYSYQACTIQLEDGREFRALINPVRNSEDKDLKQISIPYEDIRLNPDTDEKGKTTHDREVIGLKPGDVFIWKETNTHWLVYLKHIEEDAYFRAYIIRCDQWIKVDDTIYWVHVRSSVATTLDWHIQNSIIRNDPNYHVVMYMTRNKQVDDYFHRFSKIKIGQVENTWEDGEHFKNWEVVGRNPYKGDGVIELYLKEDWSNEIKEAQEEYEKQHPDVPPVPEPEEPYIEAPYEVDVYSTFTATLHNVSDLSKEWTIDNKKAIISEVKDNGIATIQVISGKSGTFNICYGEDLKWLVKIKSL